MVLDNFRTIELIWDKANKSIIKTIKTASSDTTGRYFSVKILDGGQEVTLNGASLQLYWEHPNFNTTGTDHFTTVDNKGLFNLTFSDEMLTNIGELNAHLVLTLSDGKITSDGFTIEVIKGADDGVVVPTDSNGLVKQIEGKIDKGNVTLSDLTQEVKLAITGGSVAVVGVDAVGTENVKDGAITISKLAFTAEDLLADYLTEENEGWAI
ncbi:BppU family phage baseplate upper protein [Aerococcus urinaeequi]|uniref:BppU family phage baseplate upper protein n=1 Tax=Aerococcus urinaeequi TaxID=51665 RepID=UPI003D6A4805